MSVLSGFLLDDAELKVLFKQIKQLCGCGGALKGRVIEIQGDQRNKIKQHLTSKGFKVKLAGG